MMNNNKNSLNLSIYRQSYFITGLFFLIVFSTCLILFNLADGFLPLTLILAVIFAFAGTLLTCLRCNKANRIVNPAGFNPKRDTAYYFRRMGFMIIMMYLMCMGVSFAGTFISALVSGFLANSPSLRDNLFLRGFIIKLPMFAIYLSFIYKMFIRYGFMDSQRKIFNLNLKMLSVIISLILMTPTAAYDSMFYTSTLDTFVVNLQTVFSPNVEFVIRDYGEIQGINEDFSMILVIIALLAAFIIQMAVAWFAYSRGKAIFIKQHIRKLDEYETDENI